MNILTDVLRPISNGYKLSRMRGTIRRKMCNTVSTITNNPRCDQLPDYIEKKKIENILTLKPMQTGMSYRYFFDPISKINAEMLVYRIEGRVNIKRLEAACALSVCNNAMKSVFTWKNTDQPLQIILADNPLILKQQHIDTISKEISKIWNMHVDISVSPYNIFYLYNADIQYLVVRTHHILLDGWSQTIWLNDVVNLYNQIGKKETPQLVKSSYADYVKDFWIAAKNSKAYWIRRLSGYINLQEKAERSQEQKVKVCATNRLKDLLNQISVSYAVSPAQCFYAIWILYLATRHHTDDVMFNLVAAGRSNTRDLNMVGMLMNTVPARFQISLEWTTAQFLDFVRYQTVEMLSHQQVDTIDLFSTLENGHKIYIDTCVDIQNYPISSIKNNSTEDFSLTLSEHKFLSDIPLVLAVRMEKSAVEIEFCYDSGIYSDHSIEKIMQLIIQIANQLHDSKKIKNILEKFMEI